VEVKSRGVTVKGKLGTLTKSFKHIPFETVKEKNKNGNPVLKFRMWLQKKKDKRCSRYCQIHHSKHDQRRYQRL
jgi:ribosomal protein L6P/L9E